MVRLYLAFPPRTDFFNPRRLARAALDLLLPPACVTCATPVDAPGLQCGVCFGALSAIGAPCCACCGAPFELAWHDSEGGLCHRCIDTPPPFHRARAALNYDKASRRLVLPFKHGDRTEYAAILARKMAQAGAVLLREADVLVPVPLHRRRLFSRRYNQAALLAQALGRMTGRAVLIDALIRSHATESLARKSAAERRDEVAGAFSVRPGRATALAGRRILVIDDVMTSGATASACAETLLEVGAASVDVLVAVRVPDPRLKSRGRKRFRRRNRAVDLKELDE
ncbi:MAG: ComF family protein [Acetobacteraceae bacterium]|nr:ComF family protein [Acetobacteraceae bacterium]